MNLCTLMHHAIIFSRWNGAQSVAHQTLPACQGRCMDVPTLLELIHNTYFTHSPCNKACPSGSPSFSLSHSLSPRALTFQGFSPGGIVFPSPTWPAPGGVPTFHSIPSNDASAEGTCISLCSLKRYQPTQPPTAAQSNLCTPIFKVIALFRQALSAARPTEVIFLDYNRHMNHSAS